MVASTLIIRHLGRQPYEPVWRAMQAFTDQRDDSCADELWLVEHDPVFTQGQAGKAEHLLAPGEIPVVQVDRGGQITYHGPGQLVAYPLLNLKRHKLGVRQLVTEIEQSLIELLSHHEIIAQARPDAPGVYVEGRKVASLGLRIRKGCSFHGLALNVDMDLAPFLRINPCGYAGMEMVQTRALGGPDTVEQAGRELIDIMVNRLGYEHVQQVEGMPHV
ncbi:lipoyl(octanoyl) transferase LipB [Ferrimonas gelatinilytica]|uniref:Octanoyltransferase n=1 Tax=Ferrimonas gelatinilytica TaxID=1255257 RepID=A0ABP9S761_9GAMM